VRQYYVYIVTNRKRGVLYVGVTNDVERRVYQYKHKLVHGFPTRYNLTRLVHYEIFADAYSAIAREKQIKGWLRSKKIALIEKDNPEWKDLSEGWYDDWV
jgi:putative endonuclease